jgi:HlyD family secretion protein
MAANKTSRIIGVVGAVIVLASIVALNVFHESSLKVVVQTQKMGRKDLISVVTASGEVKPKRFVNIGPNVSGRIVELTVKEGDQVRKGQVLARIESERYEAGTRMSEAAVQSAAADLARAQADLDVSRLQLARTKQMYEEKLVAAQIFDQDDAAVKMKAANVEAARRRVSQLQAQHDSNRDDLHKTTVFSPMDGVITSLPKEEGEVVIGAQSFNPTVIMTVADLSVMECEVMVDETDIRNLKLGQSAEIRVDALEGVKIKGEITEIGSSAVVRGSTAGTQAQTAGSNTGNQAKDFKVTITLKDPPPSLRPGLNATADITTATRPNALAAPIQAVVVREVDDKGKPVDPDAPPSPGSGGPEENTVVKTAKAKAQEKDGVFVVDGRKSSFRPVKTGILGETEVEVLEGLQEGEEIVSGSYKTLRTLKDGAVLKIEQPKKQGKS